MVEHFLQLNSFFPVPANHPFDQVDATVRVLPEVNFQVVRPMHRVLLNLFSERPVLLVEELRPLFKGRVTDQFTNELELVQLVVALKEGLTLL